MPSTLDLLIGSGPGQRVVVLGAVVLYAYLFLTRPDDAKAAVGNGLRLFGRMFSLILAALALAAAIQTLVSASAIRHALGEAAGVGGSVLAGLIGGMLPGGPYAVYPIVSGVVAAGAGAAAAIAMLVGYGAIGLGRVPYGLVFFDVKTVALRLGIAIPTTVAVSVGVYLLL
ncbi:hypothetical protein [Halorhabdus rudnickae]|uniref:hypothetical protein n=1 Tax=Halorhabdus rudnickae TaxID=1775544 RepID=UPI001083A7EF|nr:hypothetical protein [Halorhabdus rudnickae]